ncbi:RodZ domain-containing protein [Candidatus Spongiihabitans sp.]|uniref:RodZ domain-containing protein n=1 Tax=Candidatus Spongiihabitans sp. TaxID=3101308 RepID=UPI003C7E5130
MPKSAANSSSATPAVATPGKLFERKRRENGWSKEDVAEALLLSISQVEALENDEYDKLPGATYIIGYWRSYASLLKIDASQSIEFHKNNIERSDSVIVLEAHHRHTHGQHEKSRKKTALLFGLLAAISLAGIWYWQNPVDNLINQWIESQSNRPLSDINANNGNDANNGSDDERQSAGAEITSGTVLESDQYSIIALPEPNFSDEFDTDAPDTDAPDTDAPDTDALDADQAEASKNSEEPLNNEDRVIVETEIEPDGVFIAQEQEQKVGEAQPSIQDPSQSIENSSETSGEPADEPSQEAESPAADSPRWIFLNVEKQTWLDVRDVTGEKLIYRTAEIGEAIQLHGQPPFYVFVGATEGVQVEYLGEAIELKSDDGIYARFAVGSAE